MVAVQAEDSEDQEQEDQAEECSGDHQELHQGLHQEQHQELPQQAQQLLSQPEVFSVAVVVLELLWPKVLPLVSEAELLMLLLVLS